MEYLITYTFDENSEYQNRILELKDWITKKLVKAECRQVNKYLLVKEKGSKTYFNHCHLYISFSCKKRRDNIRRDWVMAYYKKYGTDREIEHTKKYHNSCKIARNSKMLLYGYLFKEEVLTGEDFDSNVLLIYNLNRQQIKEDGLAEEKKFQHLKVRKKFKSLTLLDLYNLLYENIMTILDGNNSMIYRRYNKKLMMKVWGGLIRDGYCLVIHKRRFKEIHESFAILINNCFDEFEMSLEDYNG